MPARASELVQRLFALEEEAVEIDVWLAGQLVADEGISEMRAAELVPARKDGILSRIDRRLSEDRSRGITSRFEWADSERTLLVAAGSGEPEGIERLARVVRFREEIFIALGKLSGRQFEHLAMDLLDLYGVPSNLRGVTQLSNDGGVDFFGLLARSGRASARLDALPLRIIGQSKKRWDKSVAAGDLAEFSHRLDQVRHGTGRAWLQLPEWFRSRDETVLGLFITCGFLGPDAKEIAVQCVIQTIEGDQVAEDLATIAMDRGWADEDSERIVVQRFLRHFPET